jgi:hypothetical protein
LIFVLLSLVDIVVMLMLQLSNSKMENNKLKQ